MLWLYAIIDRWLNCSLLIFIPRLSLLCLVFYSLLCLETWLLVVVVVVVNRRQFTVTTNTHARTKGKEETWDLRAMQDQKLILVERESCSRVARKWMAHHVKYCRRQWRHAAACIDISEMRNACHSIVAAAATLRKWHRHILTVKAVYKCMYERQVCFSLSLLESPSVRLESTGLGSR